MFTEHLFQLRHRRARFNHVDLFDRVGASTWRLLSEAALVISGSVRRSGDRLRLTSQLVDGASGCYLRSESVDTAVNDVFAAQEQVGRARRRAFLPVGGSLTKTTT